MTLAEDMKKIAEDLAGQCPEASRRYLEKLDEGPLTRQEGAVSHLCAYFLPYNPKTREIFIIHHKKSGLWLSPGGHIDKNESLLQGLNREISEELGVADFFPALPKPFLITVTPIDNPPVQPECKEHLDIWFLVETDGLNFAVDPSEFHAAKWITLEAAKNFLTEKANIEAVKILLRQK